MATTTIINLFINLAQELCCDFSLPLIPFSIKPKIVVTKAIKQNELFQ